MWSRVDFRLATSLDMPLFALVSQYPPLLCVAAVVLVLLATNQTTPRSPLVMTIRPGSHDHGSVGLTASPSRFGWRFGRIDSESHPRIDSQLHASSRRLTLVNLLKRILR